MEEIVTEILARLPVKPLLRFRSVCKAWRAIISDPVFIRAHLRCPASNWERSPRFVISPHTLDEVIPDERWPSTFSNHLRFYQWQLQQRGNGGNSPKKNNAATFLHALYVFNSATREAITLPDGYRNFLRVGGRGCCYCGGLGLDPRTGKYKAVQGFYRSWEPDTNLRTVMGMEVLTIAGEDGEDWREIRNDPPYPVERFQGCRDY
ncbi:putative F-box protein At1g47790 [Setaria italica]|uniref:putative F-box protein At1g47790 n=1 Tax=Setaria italica TaxID=4555 RepID=UPI000BE512DA|nr:putative F-box protein At1g47790 [Setaria italica]